MSGSELEFANDALTALNKHGLSELQYVTASFQPYSNAQRPDIVFWPQNVPHQGSTFFVELRLPLTPSQSLPSLEVLKEHRAFIETDPGESLYFAIATSRKIDESLHWTLLDNGIEVFERIQSGLDLANRILNWADTG